MKNKIAIILAVTSLFVACSKKNKANDVQGVAYTNQQFPQFPQNTNNPFTRPNQQRTTGLQLMGNGIVYDLESRKPVFRPPSASIGTRPRGFESIRSYGKIKMGCNGRRNFRTTYYYKTAEDRCNLLKNEEIFKVSRCEAKASRKSMYYGHNCDENFGLFPGDSARPIQHDSDHNHNDDHVNDNNNNTDNNDNDQNQDRDVERQLVATEQIKLLKDEEKVTYGIVLKVPSRDGKSSTEATIDCKTSMLSVSDAELAIPGEQDMDINKDCVKAVGELIGLGADEVPTETGKHIVVESKLVVVANNSDVISMTRVDISHEYKINSKRKKTVRKITFIDNKATVLLK